MATAKLREKKILMQAAGGRLRYAIQEGQWSRRALAEKSGVRPDAITRLEKGERMPELHSLKALATTLGVSGGWLLWGEGSAEIPLAAPEDRDQRRARLSIVPDSDPGPA